MGRVLKPSLLLAVLLPAAAHAQNPAVTVNVDAAANQRPINPFIYGVAHASQAVLTDLNCPLNRSGGNPTTRYNWQVNADNRGSDWYFESVPSGPAVAGGAGDSFIAAARAAGAEPMLTIPTIGWVAKLGSNRNKLASFSIARYGPQTDRDWQWFPDAGNGIRTTGGFVTGNDKNDANVPSNSIFQQGWMQYLVAQWGPAQSGGLRYYVLDNEPSIWHATHRDVHPVGATMDEIRDKTIDYATRVKDTDPGALVVGPEEWGWTGYFYSGYDQQWGAEHGWGNLPDRNAHGGWDYVPWLLDQLRQHEVATGRRLLDVFSLHYNWGAEAHINGATAQADVFGIFGREGLDMAARWTTPAASTPTYKAMKMYRNYDGNRSTFGDVSVAAAGPNPDQLSMFAALRSTDNALTLMAISKVQSGNTPATFNLANFPAGSAAQVWQLTSANTITQLPEVAVTGASFTATLPSQSVTLFVVPRVVSALSLGDATVTEGQQGPATAVFTVTLVPPSTQTVSVSYATADSTATAGNDYVAASGTLVFPPGATSLTVPVTVLGDRVHEASETFVVNLSAPSQATIVDGQGQGTIANDDAAGLSIADVAVTEGRFGPVTASFTVSLSPTSASTVTVDYATAPGTATAGADFTSVSGQLTFDPGVVARSVTVPVLPDPQVELPETFTVNLSGAVNATIAYANGAGRILDPPRGTDFNADNFTDLVWRHDLSGQNAVWLMNGASLVSGTFTNPSTLVDANWRIVGTNDFNADGQADLLWRHRISGQNVVWHMNGVNLVDGTFTTPSALVDVNWTMVGTGDFDLDGSADILWRHEISGQNVVWYMNGSVLSSGTFTTPPELTDANWKMAGVADFNRDGRPDILWHHRVSGQVVLWYMHGATRTAGAFTNPPALTDTSWRVVAVGDFNADERPDIVWRHAVSGQIAIWHMVDGTLVSGTLTNPPALADLNWRLVGPR